MMMGLNDWMILCTWFVGSLFDVWPLLLMLGAWVLLLTLDVTAVGRDDRDDGLLV